MSKAVSLYDIDQVTLEDITILKASINNEAGITSVEKGTPFDIKFQVFPSANLQLKKIKVNFDCSIQAYKDKKYKEKLEINASFEISFIFHIENLNDLAKENSEGLIDINGDLVSSLSNIVYSTSRGIIYTRCLGTVLGRIMLPVISTQKLLGQQTEAPKR